MSSRVLIATIMFSVLPSASFLAVALRPIVDELLAEAVCLDSSISISIPDSIDIDIMSKPMVHLLDPAR